jgi:hypothetical protein
MAELSSISKNMLLLQQQLQHLTTMTPLIVTELESLHSKVTRSEERHDRLQEQVTRLQEQVTRLQEPQIRSKAPVIKYISEEQLKKVNFTHSEIQKCEIRNRNGDLISANLTYIGICRDIWDSIESTKKIKKHTTFNYKDLIKQKEPIENGFKWCEEAGLYIQNKNANLTILEILNMVKVQRYSIEISIQLKDSDKKDIKKIYYKNFL